VSVTVAEARRSLDSDGDASVENDVVSVVVVVALPNSFDDDDVREGVLEMSLDGDNDAVEEREMSSVSVGSERDDVVVMVSVTVKDLDASLVMLGTEQEIVNVVDSPLEDELDDVAVTLVDTVSVGVGRNVGEALTSEVPESLTVRDFSFEGEPVLLGTGLRVLDMDAISADNEYVRV
jgi:hypothetical protein